jgi:hypothetical protein
LTFRSLFTSTVDDREDTDLVLPGISSDVMTQILDYAYTGQVDINRDNVFDLIVASDYLSMLCLLQLCCDFLKETLDVGTCIGDMCFAR